MNIHSRVFAGLALCCLLTAGAAWGEEEQGAAPPAMTPEQQAMMQAWEDAATPGEAHAWLMEGAGTWNVTQTMWMEPGAEPMVVHGTAVREAILGGRVLKETVTSSFMGEPFTGVAHTGYDNVTGTFWGTWMDNMGTDIYIGKGECNDDRSHCTFHLTGSDPMTGGEYTMRIETDFMDDKETTTIYATHQGQEIKTMEMVYVRAGTAEE